MSAHMQSDKLSPPQHEWKPTISKEWEREIRGQERNKKTWKSYAHGQLHLVWSNRNARNAILTELVNFLIKIVRFLKFILVFQEVWFNIFVAYFRSTSLNKIEVIKILIKRSHKNTLKLV
jgi:hypothetical protein